MILLDVNLLIYAYSPASPSHRRASQWLRGAIMGSEGVGVAWLTVLAFLRITTDTRLMKPLSLMTAVSIVADLLEHPSILILQPGERHWPILSELLPDAQARGPLVMDAHLAALAIEHGATLCTNDRDFMRFRGLKLLNPLEI